MAVMHDASVPQVHGTIAVHHGKKTPRFNHILFTFNNFNKIPNSIQGQDPGRAHEQIDPVHCTANEISREGRIRQLPAAVVQESPTHF